MQTQSKLATSFGEVLIERGGIWEKDLEGDVPDDDVVEEAKGMMIQSARLLD